MSADAMKFRRPIRGHVAVFLPHDDVGSVDWASFDELLDRTLGAGLVPAVNMDTGFTQLLDDPTRRQVLEHTSAATDGAFLAGAFVADTDGALFDEHATAVAATEVAAHGGTPVVFPSHGLNALDPDGWVEAHRRLAERCDRFIAFELGAMFIDHGRIQPLDAYAALLEIRACIGAKHSSLSRRAEWDRLALRDRIRPGFLVLTGNDLAIDMVCWGSDYLLGLATFAPEAFARRDAWWESGDARFFELNDALQALGAFAFRPPTPAYRHDAALFLASRGTITHATVPVACPRRPEGELTVLEAFADRIDAAMRSDTEVDDHSATPRGVV